ncbi:MAG: hypothetical protein PHI34_05760 [Acidobacteriota bacterium]|nr:hypothetical protein [Acidobacteriota bacterium]
MIKRRTRGSLIFRILLWKAVVLIGLIAILSCLSSAQITVNGPSGYYDLGEGKCIILEYLDTETYRYLFLPLKGEDIQSWAETEAWRLLRTDFESCSKYFFDENLWAQIKALPKPQNAVAQNGGVKWNMVYASVLESLETNKIRKMTNINNNYDYKNSNNFLSQMKKEYERKSALIREDIIALKDFEVTIPKSISIVTDEPLPEKSLRFSFAQEKNIQFRVLSSDSNVPAPKESEEHRTVTVEYWIERTPLLVLQKKINIIRGPGNGGPTASKHKYNYILLMIGLIIGAMLGVLGTLLLNRRSEDRSYRREGNKRNDSLLAQIHAVIDKSISNNFVLHEQYKSAYEKCAMMISEIAGGNDPNASPSERGDSTVNRQVVEKNIDSIRNIIFRYGEEKKRTREELLSLKRLISPSKITLMNDWSYEGTQSEYELVSDIRSKISDYFKGAAIEINSKNRRIEDLASYLTAVLDPFKKDARISAIIREIGGGIPIDTSNIGLKWKEAVDVLIKLQVDIPVESKAIKMIVEYALKCVMGLQTRDAKLLRDINLEDEVISLARGLEDFLRAADTINRSDSSPALILDDRGRSLFLESVWKNDLLGKFDMPIMQVIHRIVFKLRFCLIDEDLRGRPELWPAYFTCQGAYHLLQSVAVLCRRVSHDLLPFDPVDLEIVTKGSAGDALTDARTKKALDRVETLYENIVDVQYWGWSPVIRDEGLNSEKSYVVTRVPRRR